MNDSNRSLSDRWRRQERGALQLSPSSLLFPSDENKKITKGAVERERRKG
jgi:hypothetical protein